MVTCYICGSDFHVQARHLEYQCRVVTLCRLCSLRALHQVIFKCACGKYDFLAKYPHRLRILADRLQLPPATTEFMAEGLAIVESASCLVCQKAAAADRRVESGTGAPA